MNIINAPHALSIVSIMVSLGSAWHYNTKRHQPLNYKHSLRWDPLPDPNPTAPIRVSQTADFGTLKSVLANIWADEDIPVEDGDNRAELIMDSDSTMRRMTISHLNERLKIGRNKRVQAMVREIMDTGGAGRTLVAWQLLLDYYRDTMPALTEVFESRKCIKTLENKTAHVQGVIDYGITLSGDGHYPKVPKRFRLRRNLCICWACISVLGLFV